MEIYHKRIKELRENTDVTLKDMAKIIGVTEATVQRYESGKIHDLPYNVIVAYAKKFHVKPDYIMGWTDIKEEVPPVTTKEDLITLLRKVYSELDKMESADYFATLSNDEKVLIESYRKLSPKSKTRVSKFIDVESEIGD